MMKRRNTLALFVGGEPHHGAATPRAPRDRRADGGKTGNTPTATRSTFQITTSATSSASTATATPGGQHHDGPRGTFARLFSRGAPSYRRRPRSFTPPESPQTSTGNSARHRRVVTLARASFSSRFINIALLHQIRFSFFFFLFFIFRRVILPLL